MPAADRVCVRQSSMPAAIAFGLVAACRPADAADELRLCDRQIDAIDGVVVTQAEFIEGTDLLPPHCRAVARVSDTIHFELKLPVSWNRKFLMVGNGGYLGAFFDASYGLVRGYATASTDTGHKGPDPVFALENPEGEIDFAYRAVHLTAVKARSLVERYYEQAPSFSYFRGCSTGGRQGLIEAQRYPQDFDGYSIGAPIYDYAEKQVYNAAWVAQAMFANDGAGYLPYEKLAGLGKLVYERCDAVDGLRDGIIDDPRRCVFDARSELPQCPPGTDGRDCFTARQIESIHRVYTGPGDGRYPGHVIGAEWLDGPLYAVRGGWDTYITGILNPPAAAVNTIGQIGRDPYGGDKFMPVQLRNAQSFFRYFAFEPDRPDYDVLRDLDFDEVPGVGRIAQLMNATDTNLDRIRNGSRRILLWHGWADVGLNPLRTIQYYESIVARHGAESADEFIRLFMVPGMYHCEGGPGPDIFDDLSALERWVEAGEAPDRIVAYESELQNGFHPHRSPQSRVHLASVVRSRPLCRYPQVARYRGTGSSDEQHNFECRAP